MSPGTLQGAVFAGGAGRRFGAPKAGVPLAGVSMVERVVAVLRSTLGDPWIVGEADSAAALGLVAVPDAVAGAGPLGGLVAALERAAGEGREGILALACDLPLVDGAVVARVVAGWWAAAARGERPPVVVPVPASGPQPLCAVWSVDALSAARAALAVGRRSLRDLLGGLPGVVELDARGWEANDHRGDPFLNVNTPGDARAAEDALRGGTGAP